ncbi:LPS export ABC transporter periplasmic protein LptC [Massilia sp. PWRC2]|uniref:LPS export ABC transporter periplasmic protein LptC n=1 Tax=Massilia sp. PWRC2 TaxID=2804626 RepID=UPI003CED7BF6
MARPRHKRTSHRWQVSATIGAGVLLALGSFWLVEVINRGDFASSSVARSEPDYIVDNFSVVKMTADGKPRYIVAGDKLTHRPDNDTADIVLPVVQSLSPPLPPMTMTAANGRIDQTKNIVDMMGNVLVERPASNQGPHLRLKTEALTILTDEDKLRTDLPVEMLQGDTVVTGVGMLADRAAGQIDIYNRAHLVYPPPPPQRRR